MNGNEMIATLVVGSGGIGRAIGERAARDGPVTVWSRSGGVDVCDAASIARATAALGDTPITRVFVTTGMLHDGEQGPERSLRDLDRARLERSFLINTIAPALVAQALLPRLPRDRPTLFAALGARVGSIGDNRTGGWHGYRASKAALVMMIRTLSIEFARTHPLGVCVTLHPGTVDTAMSKPFQRGVAAEKLFTPAFAAERLLSVTGGLTPRDSGGHFAWDGARIAD